MAYDDEVAKICRLQNGYTVEIYVKPEEAKNTKKDMPMEYNSPWKSFAFGTEKEVMAFLQKHLGSLKRRHPDEDYADAFKEATTKK